MRRALNPRFSRREILAAFGLSAAAAPFVPLLESTAAGADGPPLRFCMLFHPHGTVRERWVPTGTATDFTLGEILSPLEPFADQMIVVDGLAVYPSGPVGFQHIVGPAYVYTGSEMLEGEAFEDPESERTHGWNSHASVDQVIANAVGGDTAFRSLEFGVQPGPVHPGTRISYAGPGQPLAPEGNPSAMFDRLFGDFGIDPGTAARIKAERLSIIDIVAPQLETLEGKVSQADKIKIDAHIDGIRQMETRLEATFACEPPSIGDEVDLDDYENTGIIGRQQIDLMVSAFACEATNVASVMYRRAENDGYPYPFLGIHDEHHVTSHAGDSDQAAKDDLATIYRWYAGEIAYLCERMRNTIEFDGSTLLDNTVILWASEIAKGNNHSWDDMPFVILGGGCGRLDTGRFVQAPGANHCQLLTAVCQAMGLELEAFGSFDDGSGPLPGILT